jgi:hypothetical protein
MTPKLLNENIFLKKNINNTKWLDYNVYQINDKDSFLLYLKDKYNIVMNSGNKYFKFMDNDEIGNNLKSIDHVVFFNTNPKYILLIHTKVKNKSVFIFIVKNNCSCFIVNYSSNYCENEFILEGEVFENNYLVSDLLVYDGVKNSDDIHVKRMKIDKLISSINCSNGPELRVKEYIPMNQCVSFVRDYLPRIDYKNIVNGLVFRPVSGLKNKNIILILNKPFHNLKLTKTNNNHAVSSMKINFKKDSKNIIFCGVKTSRGPDIIDLYLRNKRDELIKCGIACVPNLKNSLLVQDIFSKQNQRMIECDYCENFDSFIINKESSSLKASFIENVSI